MYFSLIITFLLLLVIIIGAIQNSMPLDFKFLTWNFQISFTAVTFYSSLIGGAIVAVLTLPGLVKKFLQVRSMNREIHKLKEKILELEKRDAGGPGVE
ncbi:MAG: lipopolysaccharide assembly protein LapA domain-containing protein [Thermodesulfobacteriota bacterium]